MFYKNFIKIIQNIDKLIVFVMFLAIYRTMRNNQAPQQCIWNEKEKNENHLSTNCKETKKDIIYYL